MAIHSWELSLFSFFSFVYLLSPLISRMIAFILPVHVLGALVGGVDQEVLGDLFIVIRHRRLRCGLDPVAEQQLFAHAKRAAAAVTRHRAVQSAVESDPSRALCVPVDSAREQLAACKTLGS